MSTRKSESRRPRRSKHTTTAPDFPKINRPPEVITNPREIAKTKARFEKELDRLIAGAMRSIQKGAEPDLECINAMKQRRTTVRDKLREIMTSQSRPGSRIMAARMLARLDDRKGEDFIVESLQAHVPLQKEALKALSEWDCKIDLTRPARARRIVSLLDHKKLWKDAASICVRRRVPGARPRLLKLLDEGRFAGDSEMLLQLAGCADSPADVQALLPHLFTANALSYRQGTGFALKSVLAHADASVSEPIRKALHQYTLRFKRERYQQQLVEDLAQTADRESIPVLRDIVEKTKDSISRAYALQALARLEPVSTLDLVLTYLAKDGAHESLIEALRRCVRPKNEAKVVAALLPGGSKEVNIGESAARLLLELGKPGRDALAANLDRLDIDADSWVHWKFQGLDLQSALSELHRAGVVPDKPKSLLTKLRAEVEDQEQRYGEGIDLNSPTGLIRALGCADLVAGFDVETGMVPCDHHWLLLEFAAGTAGTFTPECPAQQYREGDGEEPYTIEFLHGGRLYRFKARDYGDYYDADAVQDALNFALQESGRPERFLPLDTGDQVAMFVFADPAAFLPIAERYAIPVMTEALCAQIAQELGDECADEGFDDFD